MSRPLPAFLQIAPLVMAFGVMLGIILFLKAPSSLDATRQPAPFSEMASPVPERGFDPQLVRLSPWEAAALPLAVRWSQPMGSEAGALTYNAQPFGTPNPDFGHQLHLADDLNGIGGWNSDLGDPVYAAADGRVSFRGSAGEGWGNMVILSHRLPAQDSSAERVVQSVYAHLDSVSVEGNRLVKRGEILGTVGTGGGKYLAHLHFEMRDGWNVAPGGGYATTILNRLDPQKVIQGKNQ